MGIPDRTATPKITFHGQKNSVKLPECLTDPNFLIQSILIHTYPTQFPSHPWLPISFHPPNAEIPPPKKPTNHHHHQPFTTTHLHPEEVNGCWSLMDNAFQFQTKAEAVESKSCTKDPEDNVPYFEKEGQWLFLVPLKGGR